MSHRRTSKRISKRISEQSNDSAAAATKVDDIVVPRPRLLKQHCHGLNGLKLNRVNMRSLKNKSKFYYFYVLSKLMDYDKGQIHTFKIGISTPFNYSSSKLLRLQDYVNLYGEETEDSGRKGCLGVRLHMLIDGGLRDRRVIKNLETNLKRILKDNRHQPYRGTEVFDIKYNELKNVINLYLCYFNDTKNYKALDRAMRDSALCIRRYKRTELDRTFKIQCGNNNDVTFIHTKPIKKIKNKENIAIVWKKTRTKTPYYFFEDFTARTDSRLVSSSCNNKPNLWLFGICAFEGMECYLYDEDYDGDGEVEKVTITEIYLDTTDNCYAAKCVNSKGVIRHRFLVDHILRGLRRWRMAIHLYKSDVKWYHKVLNFDPHVVKHLTLEELEIIERDKLTNGLNTFEYPFPT